MTQTIRVNDSSVEKAIQKGLRQLQLTQDDVEIEVIDEGKKGLFGFGQKDAVVSITVKERIEKEEVIEEVKKELKIENPIAIDDFNKVQIKVVEILDVDKVKGADKLLKFKVFDGEFERQIISGLAKFYPDYKALVGEKVLAVSNLKFAKLKGELSQGMLLTTEDKNGVSLIKIDKSVEAGAFVS